MAKTAERKLETPSAFAISLCEEHGLDPEVLIFDVAHLHAHHRRRGAAPQPAVETIEGIRLGSRWSCRG